MVVIRRCFGIGLCAFSCLSVFGEKSAFTDPVAERPDYERFSEGDAVEFNGLAKKRPLVYSRLAEFLVERFDLRNRFGIGIDVGGGPGDLILELATRTDRFNWINTDINTWFARFFYEDASKRCVSQEVGFVFADACSLPFRDEFADLVVSRGAYPFWPDLELGLREAYRVLIKGGEAWIGRGFPASMPEDEVRDLRAEGVVGGPKYDPLEDAARFRSIMDKLGVKDYEVILHEAQDPSLKYGVWLRFKKNNLGQ